MEGRRGRSGDDEPGSHPHGPVRVGPRIPRGDGTHPDRLFARDAHRVRPSRARPRRQPSEAVFPQRRSRARMQPRRSRRRSRARIERPADLTGNSRRAHLIRLAMDLRGGHTPSVRAAAIEISRLAVAAEGPGAPFTATHRGQQLLRLIHIVVQNVGLEDKVGALTALRLLKADDTLLQKLLKAGVLPSLLGIIRADATDADADGDDDGPGLKAARAEATAAAARAVQAFSSSGDALTTLLRGGAVEVLSAYACRRGGEVADPIRPSGSSKSPKSAPPGDGPGDSPTSPPSTARARPSRASSRWRACPGRISPTSTSTRRLNATPDSLRMRPDHPSTRSTRRRRRRRSPSRGLCSRCSSRIWSCRTGRRASVWRGSRRAAERGARGVPGWMRAPAHGGGAGGKSEAAGVRDGGDGGADDRHPR